MPKTKRQPKRRHVPMRTCVACRETKPKQELARIVMQAEGSVAIDETGKLSGRGAYLCRRQSCWQTAVKRGSLQRALRGEMTPEALETIQAYAESLPAADSGA